MNAYDLRQASAPVIREASQLLVQAEDDINQIVISDTQKDSSIYLACADDAGVVQVVQEGRSGAKRGKAFSKQTLEHSRDGLVTSCGFRPWSKNLMLASGGTDFRICLWPTSHEAECGKFDVAVRRHDFDPKSWKKSRRRLRPALLSLTMIH